MKEKIFELKDKIYAELDINYTLVDKTFDILNKNINRINVTDSKKIIYYVEQYRSEWMHIVSNLSDDDIELLNKYLRDIIFYRDNLYKYIKEIFDKNNVSTAVLDKIIASPEKVSMNLYDVDDYFDDVEDDIDDINEDMDELEDSEEFEAVMKQAAIFDAFLESNEMLKELDKQMDKYDLTEIEKDAVRKGQNDPWEFDDEEE